MARLSQLGLERFEGRLEAIYPWAGALLAIPVAGAWLPRWAVAGASSLVDPIVNVAAIAVAFLVAVAAILAPMKAEPVIRELQRVEAFPRLLRYLRSAIYVWSLVIIIGIAVRIVPADAVLLGAVQMHDTSWLRPLASLTWTRILAVLWLASLVAGALSGHRILRIIFRLLQFRDPRLVRPAPPDMPDDDVEALRLPPERRRRAAG